MNRDQILASSSMPEDLHFIADPSLPYGRVLYDYLRESAGAQVPDLRAA